MNLRYLFFNDGILYWGSIFGGVTLLTAVSYTHLTLPTT